MSEIQTFALGGASRSEPPGCPLWCCQRAVDRLWGVPVKTTIRPAPWIWLLFLAIIPIRLSAEPVRPPEMLREITLDIDQDGKQDRTVLTRNDDESSYVDLTIYLGDDTDKSDLSRQPSIAKRHLASAMSMSWQATATDRYVSRFAAVGAAMMTILLSPSFTAPETFWSEGFQEAGSCGMGASAVATSTI